MYFPLLFQVISRSCFRFAHAAAAIIISTYILRCLLITIHARGSIQLIHLSGSPPPPPSRLLQVSSLLLSFRPQRRFWRLLSLFQMRKIWTLGQRTVDPCSGREATSPLDTVLALESSTTSQPQANQFSQSIEDDLGQIDQIAQDQELKSGHSLSVKGNLKNNLGFWRSIAAPDFILSIIENGYSLPFISFPLAVKLNK